MQYDQIDRISRCAASGALGALMLLAACGDDDPMPYDGPCWPLPAEPGGQVELGTGDLAFEPMPDVPAVIRNGSQADPFLRIHSRIRGMPPGDPDDFFDPRNPKTKVGLAIDELGLALGEDCPASLGYVSAPEPDAFDMVHSLRIGFGMFPLDQVAGKQARITVEVVGSNRRYARDERLVTLMIP